MISAKDIIVLIQSPGEEITDEIPKEPIDIYKIGQQTLFYISIYADKTDFLEQVFKACEPAGLNYGVKRQYYPSGAFVLDGIPIDSKYDYSWEEKPLWRGYHPLIICKSLSRLVHLTTVSLEYAARCFFEDEKLISIAPQNYCGWATTAFLPMCEEEAVKQRSWFTAEELETLKKLFMEYLNGKLPRRLSSLLWFYELAFSTDIRTVRWLFITQALQAAVSTDSMKVRQQFIKRLPELAKELGIPIKKKETEDIWGYRNKVSHGGRLREANPEEFQLLQKAEEIIRRSIKKSLLDASFASIWGNEDVIQQKWPVDLSYKKEQKIN